MFIYLWIFIKIIFVQFGYVSLVIKCIIRSGQFDVYKVLKFWIFFILCKIKPLILKNYGWSYIDDYEGMVSLKFWIFFLF
jgi:hypothetical protein